MSTDRAQPLILPPQGLPGMEASKLDLTLRDPNPNPGKIGRPSTRMDQEHKFQIRNPLWAHEKMKTAAQDEGLSLNAWCQRVLVEAAQRSINEGWRTIPIGDKRPAPAPVLPATPAAGLLPGLIATTTGSTAVRPPEEYRFISQEKKMPYIRINGGAPIPVKSVKLSEPFPDHDIPDLS